MCIAHMACILFLLDIDVLDSLPPTSLALLPGVIPFGDLVWKSLILDLSVSSVLHLVPWCPRWYLRSMFLKSQGSGFLPSFSCLPQDSSCQHGKGFPVSVLERSGLMSYLSLSLGWYASAFWRNLCGRRATDGGNQLPPAKQNTVWYFKLSFPPYVLID